MTIVGDKVLKTTLMATKWSKMEEEYIIWLWHGKYITKFRMWSNSHFIILHINNHS